MKKIGIKLISVFQIIVLMISIILPIITLFPTEVIARDFNTELVEQMKQGKKSINQTLKGIRVWIEEDAYKAAVFNVRTDLERIELDQGVDVWVAPAASPKGDYYTELQVIKGGLLYETVTKYENVEKISLPVEKINEYVDNNNNVIFRLVSYYYENNSKIGEINIDLRQNSIVLDNSNKGISEDGLLCNNAIIQNNILYVKPNSEVILTTEWGNSRTSYSKNGIFYVNGRASVKLPESSYTYKVPNELGKTVEFKWINMNGTSCSLNMVVSNFANNSIKVTELPGNTKITNASTNSKAIDYDTNKMYTISKYLHVVKGSESTIKVEHNKQFENKDIALTGLTVEDISGFSEGTLNSKIHETCYTINFKAKEGGILKVQYSDYTGTKYDVYWQILLVDNIDSLDKIKDENKEEDVQTGVPQNPNTGNIGDTTNGSNNIKTYDEPKIEYTSKRINEGTIKFDFKITNCTAVKYVIKERKQNSDGTLGEYEYITNDYSKFEGTEVSNPNSFSVIMNSVNLGSGKFDITVLAKNTDDLVTSYFALGPNSINLTPNAGIAKITNAQIENGTATNTKKYIIYGYDADKGDTFKLYYYLEKKENKTSYVKPSVENILKNGTKIENNNSDIVISTLKELSTDKTKFGTGYYDLTVYVEDKNGAFNTSYIENICVSEAPEIEFEIIGENGTSKDGYTYSKTPRNGQKVKIKVSDKDGDNNLKLYYFVTEKALSESELSKVFNNSIEFINSGYEIKSANLKNNYFIQADLPAVEGKRVSKYVYMCATDSLGATRFVSTGSIVVDDTPLQLDCIFANKINNSTSERTGYSVGEKLEITFRFNHIMKEQCPDLYITVGTTKRKQNNVKYNGNEITYIYDIQEAQSGVDNVVEAASGEISFAKLDYANNQFIDIYEKENKFEQELKEILNNNEIIDIVTVKYYIDTVTPRIDHIEINLTTKENSNIYEDTVNNIKYISEVDSAQLKVLYSEHVIKKAPRAEIILGDNTLFLAETKEEGKRIEDIYNLTNWIQFYSFMKIQGKIELNNFSSTYFTTDISGNKLNANIPTAIVYKLNGVDVGDTPIVLDDDVYSGEIIAEGKEVEEQSAYSVNTEVMCFAEYKNENKKDYEDLSGLKNVTLKVWENNNSVMVKDKDGDTLVKDANISNTDTNYTNLAQYTLTEQQLPVSFVIPEEENYKVSTIKTDNLGNTTTKTVEITGTSSVEINEELSGLDIGKTEKYNYKLLTDEQKQYTLALKLDSEISKENIEVKILDLESKILSVKYIGQITQDNETYEKYAFNINRGGTYYIEVSNTENNMVLLNEKISIDNVYIPGDTNYDGMLTAQDIVNVQRYMIGYTPQEELAKVFISSDVDGNKKVDIVDVVKLSRYISQDSEVTTDENGYIIIKND